jgi:hypothetical protein
MKRECFSEQEENTFEIFKTTVSEIKRAGKEELAQKWEDIIHRCRKKPPSR